MSFFESVTQLPDDQILHIPIAFAADPRPNKVNLGIGSYKDHDGKSILLDCVHKAEISLANKKLNKEYQPIEGDAEFHRLVTELIFGKDFLDSFTRGLFVAQSLGGTGALHLGSEFLVQETSKTIFIPSPSWSNHRLIFNRIGLKVHSYRYFDERTHQIDFNGMCSDISNAPPGSTILLHAGCHNPTGIDPTFEQWKELSVLIKQQRVIPFFDFAYQGFVSSLEEDALPIRYFASQGHEMLVANSFSKNLGLYGERVGAISIIAQHPEAAQKVGSQIKQIIRSNYSNPPLHGPRIVTEILSSETLTAIWHKELATMRDRIKEMRLALIKGLQTGESLKDWSFLQRQNGFFSYCGLNPEQVERLLKEYAIYMPTNGRINVAGLNKHNLDYVIKALIAVTQ